MSVCWASFDPVRRKVDIYPGPIASRIEKAYGERDIYAPGSCVLGSDFFNATVNFHPNGSSSCVLFHSTKQLGGTCSMKVNSASVS